MIYKSNGPREVGPYGYSTEGSVDLKDLWRDHSKKIVIAIVAVVGFLFILGIIGASSDNDEEAASGGEGFSQSQAETLFWVKANESGEWDRKVGREGTLDYGYNVCRILDTNSVDSVMNFVFYQEETSVSQPSKGDVVLGAVSFLCPEHETDFMVWYYN